MYWEDRKNMQKSIIRKGLVFLVIILFIGIAVAPGVTSIDISKNNPSNNDDLVEITLQLCKTDGAEEHKMYITQEQDEQLDSLIESFKADLDKADTREETIKLYEDMVISLDELGILPEDLSCEEAQQLVIGDSYGFNKVKNFVEHKKPIFINCLAEKDKTSKETSEELENYLCQISGQTSKTNFLGLIGKTLYKIVEFFEKLKCYNICLLLLLLVGINELFYTKLNLLPIRADILLGYTEGSIPPGEIYYHPSNGWVHTIGSLGIKNLNGSFYGKISSIGAGVFTEYIGASGFTGIRIIRKNFYIGRALKVKLGSDKP